MYIKFGIDFEQVLGKWRTFYEVQTVKTEK